MAIRTFTLDEELEAELYSLQIDGKRIKLPTAMLNRYSEIKKILLGAGGKYNKGGFFTFHDETYAQAAIDAALGGESLNLKKRYPFYPTPPEIGAKLIERLGDIRGLRILEPHAGDGALADLARNAGASEVATVDIWNVNTKTLAAKGYQPIEADFLSLSPADLGLFN